MAEERTQQIAKVTYEELKKLIWQCVQKRPEDRPTMEEILNKLESYAALEA